jgi:hypothetical protein
MAFRKYAAFFQPHELEALNTAYNVAWERMATKPMNTAEASNLKNRLAQVILASACTGERDAKRLEQIALRALASGRSGKQLEAEQC